MNLLFGRKKTKDEVTATIVVKDIKLVLLPMSGAKGGAPHFNMSSAEVAILLNQSKDDNQLVSSPTPERKRLDNASASATTKERQSDACGSAVGGGDEGERSPSPASTAAISAASLSAVSNAGNTYTHYSVVLERKGKTETLRRTRWIATEYRARDPKSSQLFIGTEEEQVTETLQSLFASAVNAASTSAGTANNDNTVGVNGNDHKGYQQTSSRRNDNDGVAEGSEVVVNTATELSWSLLDTMAFHVNFKPEISTSTDDKAQMSPRGKKDQEEKEKKEKEKKRNIKEEIEKLVEAHANPQSSATNHPQQTQTDKIRNRSASPSPAQNNLSPSQNSNSGSDFYAAKRKEFWEAASLPENTIVKSKTAHPLIASVHCFNIHRAQEEYICSLRDALLPTQSHPKKAFWGAKETVVTAKDLKIDLADCVNSDTKESIHRIPIQLPALYESKDVIRQREKDEAKREKQEKKERKEREKKGLADGTNSGGDNFSINENDSHPSYLTNDLDNHGSRANSPHHQNQKKYVVGQPQNCFLEITLCCVGVSKAGEEESNAYDEEGSNKDNSQRSFASGPFRDKVSVGSRERGGMDDKSSNEGGGSSSMQNATPLPGGGANGDAESLSVSSGIETSTGVLVRPQARRWGAGSNSSSTTPSHAQGPSAPSKPMNRPPSGRGKSPSTTASVSPTTSGVFGGPTSLAFTDGRSSSPHPREHTMAAGEPQQVDSEQLEPAEDNGLVTLPNTHLLSGVDFTKLDPTDEVQQYFFRHLPYLMSRRYRPWYHEYAIVLDAVYLDVTGTTAKETKRFGFGFSLNYTPGSNLDYLCSALRMPEDAEVVARRTYAANSGSAAFAVSGLYYNHATGMPSGARRTQSPSPVHQASASMPPTGSSPSPSKSLFPIASTNQQNLSQTSDNNEQQNNNNNDNSINDDHRLAATSSSLKRSTSIRIFGRGGSALAAPAAHPPSSYHPHGYAALAGRKVCDFSTTPITTDSTTEREAAWVICSSESECYSNVAVGNRTMATSRFRANKDGLARSSQKAQLSFGIIRVDGDNQWTSESAWTQPIDLSEEVLNVENYPDEGIMFSAVFARGERICFRLRRRCFSDPQLHMSPLLEPTPFFRPIGEEEHYNNINLKDSSASRGVALDSRDDELAEEINDGGFTPEPPAPLGLPPSHLLYSTSGDGVSTAIHNIGVPRIVLDECESGAEDNDAGAGGDSKLRSNDSQAIASSSLSPRISISATLNAAAVASRQPSIQQRYRHPPAQQDLDPFAEADARFHAVPSGKLVTPPAGTEAKAVATPATPAQEASIEEAYIRAVATQAAATHDLYGDDEEEVKPVPSAKKKK